MTLLIVADGTHRSGGDGKETVSGDGHEEVRVSTHGSSPGERREGGGGAIVV